MATVLALIGEPFDPAVLEFHQRRRPVGTDPVNDRNIQMPLQVANSGKWAGAISQRELEIFESIAGPMLDACGYPARHRCQADERGRTRRACDGCAQPLRKATAMLAQPCRHGGKPRAATAPLAAALESGPLARPQLKRPVRHRRLARAESGQPPPCAAVPQPG